MSVEVLRTEHLTVGYMSLETGVEARLVENVDFSISSGSLVGIYGASGVGKSSLIKVMAGLLRPLAGDVFLGGASLTKISRFGLAALLNKKIGFMYQDRNLLEDFTVFENIFMPARLKWAGDGDRLSQIEEEINELLTRFKLAHRTNARPCTLSGGESQRVALLRALINKPDILFCDEPTGNLDPESKYRVMDMFQELQKSYGTAIVVVTHDLEYKSISEHDYFLENKLLISR